MIIPISISDFIWQQPALVLADVRTPAEFAQGHVPGAVNLPLFSNEERVRVGTTYKQIGREEAILLGFELTGPKWADFIRQALVIAPDQKIALHCWRGGMRSGAMAWALNLYGFEVYLIDGGYKSYRHWVHQQFTTDQPIQVLGGMTGSGKTRMLHQLATLGEQVIDLEDLAQHQGSSYGTLNRLVQPTQEQFENNLAQELKNLDHSRRLWIEDESRNIGRLIIPPTFWEQMQRAVLINIVIDQEQRVQNLVADYGTLDKDFLITCTERIHKRLGPLATRQAVESIRADRMDEFVRSVLAYYDKTYHTALRHRPPDSLFSIDANSPDIARNAQQLLRFAESITLPEQANPTHANLTD